MPIYTKNNNIIKLSGIYVGNSSKNPIQISKVYRGDSNGTPILVYSSHTHSYGTTHTKESTGVYYVTCSCGAKRPCDVEYDNGKAAGCTSYGYNSGYYCNDHHKWVYGGSSISPLGHDIDSLEYDASGHYCNRCGNYITHTLRHYVTASGESVSGYYGCEYCNYTEHHDVIATSNSQFNCTTPGYYDMYCNTCGKDLDNIDIPALGHFTSSDYVYADSYDMHRGQCSRCNTYIHEAHTFNSSGKCVKCDYYCEHPDNCITGVYTIKTPSCTETGISGGTCENCGKTITISIPALGHIKDTANASHPSCGCTVFPCKRCGGIAEISPSEDNPNCNNH